MKYIDLHVHSNVSDGTLSPADVVEAAVKANLAAFALTDHDTTDGVAEALLSAAKYRKQGYALEVIPGVEISAAFRERDIHMLGLLINHSDNALTQTLAGARLERSARNEKMADNLKGAGIDISMDLLRQADPDAVITRAHFAKYLVAHHYVKDNKEAFLKYLDSSTPYYVARNYMAPEKAIRLILNAGGVPVLAHPLLYHLADDELAALLGHLKDCGLVGIETFYSSNMGYDETRVRRLAGRFGLLMTGGSDFHGQAKPHIQIGVGRGNLRIPYSVLENLRLAAGKA